jgi:hypothetical protein
MANRLSTTDTDVATILAERHARGEITEEQYDRLLIKLSRAAPQAWESVEEHRHAPSAVAAEQPLTAPMRTEHPSASPVIREFGAAVDLSSRRETPSWATRC